MINTPEELQHKLVELYPSLEKELEEEDGFDYGYKPEITYHHVWMAFTIIANECLTGSDIKTLKKFCYIVNYMVGEGGDKENSVSTCLLEHASQIGIIKIIKPYLVSGAKNELC
ncbi:MAG: hypothetical protein methR_P3026 [Methyloprofundus sp.]|nr:MAG: hypothetical protein methR_P3026 [Methyloprofundus sp.]